VEETLVHLEGNSLVLLRLALHFGFERSYRLGGKVENEKEKKKKIIFRVSRAHVKLKLTFDTYPFIFLYSFYLFVVVNQLGSRG